MVAVLLIVTTISSALLSWTNSMTDGAIQKQKRLALADGIKKAMCVDALQVASSDTVRQTADGREMTFVVHKVDDTTGHHIGVAIESTVVGFSDNLKVLVGFAPTGKILGYDVLEHSETPGLGAKSAEWFQTGGKGCIIGRQMDAGNPLAVSKDGGDVEAITASTITSRAFLKAVNNAYTVYQSQAHK